MGPYWAIGCLAEIYRAVAIVGVVVSVGMAPFTAGVSLLILPLIFLYIVVAQLFKLLIDIAQSSRGTYEVLSRRSERSRVPPNPSGMWDDDENKYRRR